MLRVVVLKEAAPPEFKVAVPRVVAPSLKTTEPVGMVPLLATTAVNCTETFCEEGFGVEARVTEAVAFCTVCVMRAEVLGRLLASPP
jgi:hypothetical protein